MIVTKFKQRLKKIFFLQNKNKKRNLKINTNKQRAQTNKNERKKFGPLFWSNQIRIADLNTQRKKTKKKKKRSRFLINKKWWLVICVIYESSSTKKRRKIRIREFFLKKKLIRNCNGGNEILEFKKKKKWTGSKDKRNFFLTKFFVLFCFKFRKITIFSSFCSIMDVFNILKIFTSEHANNIIIKKKKKMNYMRRRWLALEWVCFLVCVLTTLLNIFSAGFNSAYWVVGWLVGVSMFVVCM